MYFINLNIYTVYQDSCHQHPHTSSLVLIVAVSLSCGNTCSFLEIRAFMPWEEIAQWDAQWPPFSAPPLSRLLQTVPFISNRGRFGASSDNLAPLPLSGLSGVYLVCVHGAQRVVADPGDDSPSRPLLLSTTPLFSLCLNGREALAVGKALHQKGAEGRRAPEREREFCRDPEASDGEEEEGGDARCVGESGGVGIKEGGGS